jgi:AcrR family transcriptional regulator
MADTSTHPPRRRTYRHGDLHHALLQAGTELARAGGPDAVVLREATRRAGVAPNAAYRHFADRQALLAAVRSAAQAALAAAIEAELAKLPPHHDPTGAARARLRAVGTGYLRFAQTEPGLFRTAFSVPPDRPDTTGPARTDDSGMRPYQLLAAALDDLVAAGVLPPKRRPGAELLAWSAVHGLAVLLIDGPLRGLDQTRTRTIAQRLLDMVERGL